MDNLQSWQSGHGQFPPHWVINSVALSAADVEASKNVVGGLSSRLLSFRCGSVRDATIMTSCPDWWSRRKSQQRWAVGVADLFEDTNAIVDSDVDAHEADRMEM